MRAAACIHTQKNELLRLSLEVHHVTLSRANVEAASVINVVFGGVVGKSGEACGYSNLAVRCVLHAAQCVLLASISYTIARQPCATVYISPPLPSPDQPPRLQLPE